MMSIFEKFPKLTLRYSNPEATTVGGMLRTVPCLDSRLPIITFVHRDRVGDGEIAARLVLNPNKLENGMDMVRLQMYLMEFFGEGYDARNDASFVQKRMMQLLKRMDSRYENAVLIMFGLMSKNHETFKEKILEHRRNANEFWKVPFIETSQAEIDVENMRFKGIVDKYRWVRIHALKKIYRDEWTNWIWRILDIDEIGIYFYATDPNLIKIENDSFHTQKGKLGKKFSGGWFGNCNAYLE